MKLSIISLSCCNVHVGSNSIFDLASFKVLPRPTRETSIPVNSNSVGNIRNQLLVIASIKYLADCSTAQKGEMIAEQSSTIPEWCFNNLAKFIAAVERSSLEQLFQLGKIIWHMPMVMRLSSQLF